MDELEEIKQRINLLQFIQNIYDLGKSTKTNGGYLFKNCPICNSTSSKNGDAGHFFVNDNTNSYSSFSGCCKGGSIIDFLMEYNNLDKKEAILKAKEIAGIRSGDVKKMNNNTKPQTNIKSQQTQEEKQKAEFIRNQKKQFILNNLAKQNSENKQKVYEYLESRGISKEIGDKYHLFISSEVYEDKSIGTEGTTRIVIPIYKDKEPVSYVARALTNIEGRAKALNSAGEQTPLNIDYLKHIPTENENKCIYICEGWADALSIEDTGNKAIATHSTNQITKLTEYIKENYQVASQYTYLLCFDNDTAGTKATETFEKIFENDINIKSQRIKIPKDYKDINEWYVATGNKEFFKEYLNPFRNENVFDYINTSFLNDIKKMNKFKGRTTGFKALDKELNGVYPGLYVLGAISSLGKTTFITQVADQMAKNGEKVIFFSLEQSRFELVSKSISRETFKINPREAKTSLSIMQNTNIEEITLQAVKEYQEIANNTIVVEGNFNITVNTIRKYIENYISVTGIKPVVVLDYLQILRPISDKLTDKQQVDYNVVELKRISRDFDIPIFVICSFNRENYTNTVDFSSFKESGAIEYSADVVMGLQLKVMDTIIDLPKNTKISEIRNMINDAKSQRPREIQLVCLKNRNGMPYFKCEYKYYSAYNFFEEEEKNNYMSFSNKK